MLLDTAMSDWTIQPTQQSAYKLQSSDICCFLGSGVLFNVPGIWFTQLVQSSHASALQHETVCTEMRTHPCAKHALHAAGVRSRHVLKVQQRLWGPS